MHTTFMSKASGTHISTLGQCPMPLSCSTNLRTTVNQCVVFTLNASAAVRAATECHLSGSTAHASFSAYAPWYLVVSMGVTRSRAFRSGLSCGGGSPGQSLLRFCPRLLGYIARMILSRGVPQKFHLEVN